jgi:replicative DNA helicase
MKGGELIVIGARPSNGKTSLMIHIADHVAIELKKRVAIFSIECQENEIWNKFVSRRARVPTKKLRIGRLDDYQQSLVNNAIDLLADCNIHLNDVSIMTSLGVRANVRRMIINGQKPDLIMLDYLGLVRMSNGSESKSEKIGMITKDFKALAKDLDIPFVLLAQMNRKAGEEGGMPKLHHLRDSGEIEQDVDQAWFTYIPMHELGEKCPEDQQNKMYIGQKKNRNGATLDLEVNWDGENTRIYE